jgi:hypothetical protein
MINMSYAFGALFSYAIESVHGQGYCPPDFIQYGSANVTGINQKARLKICPFSLRSGSGSRRSGHFPETVQSVL